MRGAQGFAAILAIILVLLQIANFDVKRFTLESDEVLSADSEAKVAQEELGESVESLQSPTEPRQGNEATERQMEAVETATKKPPAITTAPRPVVLTTWKGDLPPPSDVERKATETLVTCTTAPEECCGTWEVNADAWWLHHPEWKVSTENETHFCFTPLANEREREFMRTLHEHQWGGDCSNLEKSVNANSGFGSSIAWDLKAFFHAWRQRKQFQLIHGGRVWLYSTTNESSWAYCESRDSRCYFLPVGRCSRNETIRGEHFEDRPKHHNETDPFNWIKKYATRPNQLFRRKTFEMVQRLNLQTPCTTIHIRRGDAGLPRPPYRRYAAVQEYLDAGNVEKGDNVFLMTDDDSTLDEVEKHLKDKYNFVYFKKSRNRDISNGFDGHTPSGDQALEMVIIASERELASRCSKLVFGASGFIKSLMEDMAMEGKSFTKYFLDTSVSKQEAHKFDGKHQERVQKFLQDIEELYAKLERGEYTKPPTKDGVQVGPPTVPSLTASQSAESPSEGPNKGDVSASDILDSKEKSPTQAAHSSSTLHKPNPDITPLDCQTTSKGEECCASWSINVDDWWTHHPTWEVSNETETVQCFSPIKRQDKAAFFQEIYERQWKGDCSRTIASTQIGSGFGASSYYLTYTFLNATIENRPFQIAQHDFRWLFGPKSKDSWGYCESEDITCYILPISKCDRVRVLLKDLDEFNKNRYWTHPDDTSDLHFQWVKAFMLRPTQVMRRKVLEMKMQIKLATPCTTMHVRRGDVGFPQHPYRRYAAVQEYLDAANLKQGANILLLTDDQTTIDEINTYHTGFNWAYLNRTRISGVDGGWQGHVPSGDGPFEIAAILTETDLASQCTGMVHGNSGYIKGIMEKMKAEGISYTSYYVETNVGEEEIKNWNSNGKDRAKYLLKELERYRNKSHVNEKASDILDSKQDSKSSEKSPTQAAHSTPSLHKPNPDNIPLDCQTTSTGEECCASWSINVDDWWTHHPTWEVSKETETVQCFSPIKQQDKATFFQQIYDRQWKGDCSKTIASTQINSGFGASSYYLTFTFLNATIENRPFQIAQHDFSWLFGPKSKDSWGYCESEDITCYILPISKCDRVRVLLKDLDEFNKNRYWTHPADTSDLHFQWVKAFMLRPTQVMRRKVLEMRMQIKLATPCTTMHVRRGDVGFPQHPYRRYAAVQEYLDAANLKQGANILLLTDDQTTIDEINTYHTGFNWAYLNRTRKSGVDGGWQGHVPSGDGPFEIAAILAETDLASHCSSLVHGNSGYIKGIKEKMTAEGISYTTYYVETMVSEEEIKKWESDGKDRAKYLLKELESYHVKSHTNEKDKVEASKKESTAERVMTQIQGESQNTTDSIICIEEANQQECCASWDVNVDDWWTHKPTWEVSRETENRQCFMPMKSTDRANYFQRLYDVQWKGNCSRLVSTSQINSGYGASTNWLAYSFLKASMDGFPFQPLVHDTPWLYGPSNKTSWAYCDEQDISCFTLPLSKCKRVMLPSNQKNNHQNHFRRPDRNSAKEKLEFEWLKEFMLRPTQAVRRKLFQMRSAINLTTPCTAMHVRRGDSGLPRQPFRRYAAVQEYLDAAEVEEGSTVFLLTDDQTTIDEIHQYHKDYKWVYLNKTRPNGVDAGWESHVPSGDGPFEVLAIQTETYLAGQCNKIVHGKSGFMQVVRGIMEAQGKVYKAYVIDTTVAEAEARKWPRGGKERVAHFLKEMEEYRKKSNERRKQKKEHK